MNKISYSGYRFPPEIIQQAIWFYLRFTLSLRDVEDLLAERGVAVSYETVRRWVNHRTDERGRTTEIEARRKAFLRKWRLKCHAVAYSLEEAGDRLFTFTRFPPSQWKSLRTSNAIERLREEFKRRIKTQTLLPCAESAAMLFWALLASGQITMRKVEGWHTLAEQPADQIIDLAA